MATLETQYKQYLDTNPQPPLSYEAWLKKKGIALIEALREYTANENKTL